MKNALLPAGLFFAAALTGCMFGNSSEDTANPGVIIQTIPFKVEGNTIITVAYTRPYSYCSGDEMQSGIDTMEADTVAYRISGSSMEILPDNDTLGSGAVIQHVFVFTRQGSGSGLQGLWSGGSRRFKVVTGTPTETENSELEDDQTHFDHYSAFVESWVRFAGGKIISYEDRESAKLFIAEWNGEFDARPDSRPDSARYAITVKALDKNTVELKGLKNGETVRFTLNFGETTYSSDTPGHAFHRYLSNPKTCPNEYSPEWYEQFMEANWKAEVLEKRSGPRKSLQKSVEIHPISGNTRHFPFGPLKTPGSLLN